MVLNEVVYRETMILFGAMRKKLVLVNHLFVRNYLLSVREFLKNIATLQDQMPLITFFTVRSLGQY